VEVTDLKKGETLLFGLLMLVLIPIELLCAYLAYETIGEVVSVIYFLAVGINLVFIVLAVRNRTLAALGAVVLGLVIIPYQLVLGQRLIRVQAEAANVVSYVYEQRLASGEYPADLSNYEFHDSAMASYVQSYRPDETRGGFVLAYRVGTETTSHTYSPQDGWSYYAD
jgi:hypothetical protein